PREGAAAGTGREHAARAHGPRAAGPRLRPARSEVGRDTVPEWELRAPAPELADAYRRAGWWNDDTLGQLVERGMTAAPNVPVRIWSATRPWAGTLGDLLDRSRRLAA